MRLVRDNTKNMFKSFLFAASRIKRLNEQKMLQINQLILDIFPQNATAAAFPFVVALSVTDMSFVCSRLTDWCALVSDR